MLAIAGKTAGPIWLNFFREPMDNFWVTYAEQNCFVFFQKPFFLMFIFSKFDFLFSKFHEQRRALQLVKHKPKRWKPPPPQQPSCSKSKHNTY